MLQVRVHPREGAGVLACLACALQPQAETVHAWPILFDGLHITPAQRQHLRQFLLMVRLLVCVYVVPPQTSDAVLGCRHPRL